MSIPSPQVGGIRIVAGTVLGTTGVTVGGISANRNSRLAFTGSPTTTIIVIAAVLLVSGLALMAFARKRNPVND
ncbi:MAG: LPXTG cell wall anchor domain-containing protein [Acidimicrobiia bacterium]